MVERFMELHGKQLNYVANIYLGNQGIDGQKKSDNERREINTEKHF